MDLEAALADADYAIQQTEKKLEEIQARLQALREERRGLELAISRHGATALVSTGTEAEWRALNRTDAIERVLKDASRAMSPSEILETLRQRGRDDDTPPYVSAALSYLAKRRRVVRLRQGQWAVPNQGIIANGLGAVGAAGAVALALGALAASGRAEEEETS